MESDTDFSLQRPQTSICPSLARESFRSCEAVVCASANPCSEGEATVVHSCKLLAKGSSWCIDRLCVTQHSTNARDTVQKSGREIPKNPVLDVIGFVIAELMFLNSVLYSCVARSVTWRGIHYRVGGPHDITLVAYQPFEERPALEINNPATVV